VTRLPRPDGRPDGAVELTAADAEAYVAMRVPDGPGSLQPAARYVARRAAERANPAQRNSLANPGPPASRAMAPAPAETPAPAVAPAPATAPTPATTPARSATARANPVAPSAAVRASYLREPAPFAPDRPDPLDERVLRASLRRGRPDRRVRIVAAAAGLALLAIVAVVGMAGATGDRSSAGIGLPATPAPAASPAVAAGASPLAASTAGSDVGQLGFGAPDLFDLGAKALLVCALLYVTLRVLRRMQTGTIRESGLIHVLETRPLAPKASVYLVAVGDRRLLVGLTPSGIITLAELDASEVPDGIRAEDAVAPPASLAAARARGLAGARPFSFESVFAGLGGRADRLFGGSR
jgi:flagellar biosynthetic protein FliO